jgi:hypothetical protein
MKPPTKPKAATPKPKLNSAVERGLAAAKAMSKELTAEHKRWNMPLLTWKDGKVVAVKP